MRGLRIAMRTHLVLPGSSSGNVQQTDARGTIFAQECYILVAAVDRPHVDTENDIRNAICSIVRNVVALRDFGYGMLPQTGSGALDGVDASPVVRGKLARYARILCLYAF